MIEDGVPHTHPYASIVDRIRVLPGCSLDLVFIHSHDQSPKPPCLASLSSCSFFLSLANATGLKESKSSFYISSFVYFALDKKKKKSTYKNTYKYFEEQDKWY